MRRLIVVRATIAQDDHLVGHHLSAEVTLPVVVLPTARLQPALHIYLLSFSEVLLANLCQRSPGDHIEPLGFFATFAIRGNPCAARGKTERGDRFASRW
jgi:hypothetical protein